MTAFANAANAAASTALPTTDRAPFVGVLRTLLLAEAALALALTVFLSMLAGTMDSGLAADDATTARFAAGGAFLFAILAAIGSRGARRRRGWSWTLAALLQLVMAIGTGIAVLTVEWHPAFLVGFGLATVVMLVLSTTTVRRALGQE
jgi:hypothetical protein